jgi:hypothetical protein
MASVDAACVQVQVGLQLFSEAAAHRSAAVRHDLRAIHGSCFKVGSKEMRLAY